MNNFLLGTVSLDTSAVTSALGGAAADIITMFMALLPIALGVFATGWGVQKALGFFKKTTQ